MRQTVFDLETPAAAVSWMLERGLILRKTTKDPETFIPVQAYVLSDELREEIGSNLVKLFKKATKGSGLKDVTIGDAFVTAAIAAVLRSAETSLSQDELTMCTNIILKLLPFDKLETAGITSKTLRHLSRDRTLLRKLREACGGGRSI
jgi:hypothetical protein